MRLISRGADGPRGKFNSMCGLSAMMCVFLGPDGAARVCNSYFNISLHPPSSFPYSLHHSLLRHLPSFSRSPAASRFSFSCFLFAKSLTTENTDYVCVKCTQDFMCSIGTHLSNMRSFNLVKCHRCNTLTGGGKCWKNSCVSHRHSKSDQKSTLVCAGFHCCLCHIIGLS